MNIASRTKMCSTLVVGGFVSYYDRDEDRCIKNTVRSFKEQIKLANMPTFQECVYDNEGRLQKRHYLGCYKVKDFAFFVTTIFADRGYPKVFVKCLRKLGFIVDTDIKQYNSKNETMVYMVYGPVDVVLKKLDLYDDVGNLVKKTEVVEEKPKRSRKKKLPEAVAA